MSKENINISFTKEELIVTVNLINFAVKGGLPSIGDASNALVIFNKLQAQLPKEDDKEDAKK